MRSDKEAKRLASRLSKRMKRVRAAYLRAAEKNEETPLTQWLRDNYYILDSEGKSTVSELKRLERFPRSEASAGRLLKICSELCERGALPDRETLIQRLSEKKLKGCETEALPLFLKTALLFYAAQACEGDEGGAKLLGNSVGSLRRMGDTDFEEIIRRTGAVEKIFAEDPSGDYRKMDDTTRALYRRRAALLAAKEGTDAETVAANAVEKAREGKTARERHVGSYLIKREANRRRGKTLLALEALLPLAVASACAALTSCPWLVPLLWLPLWELLRCPLEAIIMKNAEVFPLPRVELCGRVPETAKTLITVSTLLPDASGAAELKKRLTELYRSNAGENVKICLLADLKGADSPELPEDAANLAAARRVIEALNKKYSGGFIAAVRARSFSPTQNSFTGRERKRGAIRALAKTINGEENEFALLVGDISDLQDTKYILALDSDTVLPIDTATQLVSVALHPLNRPVIDEKLGRVTEGCGIIAPKMSVDLGSADRTAFSKLMAGGGGITAYDSFAAERYQDLFGEGIFAGKGLIDVEAFSSLAADVFPEELVLSHDILEGSLLRCGFASDIEASDGFPKRHGSFYSRLERWVRGDWQNVRFISRKYKLNALSRYKLFDNLRRCAVPVNALAGILLACLLPSAAGNLCVLLCALCAAGDNLWLALRSAVSGGFAMFSRLYYSSAAPAALAGVLRAAISLVMLPKTAAVCLGGAMRALWRQTVSKKGLLDWTTAAQSEKENKFLRTLRECLPSLLCAAILFTTGTAAGKLCAVAFLSDLPFAYFSGREREKKPTKIREKSREKLVSYAAAMWEYFNELCTKENNWLPPDNMQEAPVFRIAQRTSPTNIGLMLLCVLAARDLSFITTDELYSRVNRALLSVERMEKWRGNLLNWYSTSTLEPLRPKYVSTVDSGNFLCCLVSLKKGLSEYAFEHPGMAELTERIETLISACDIASLYNSRRRLFHIGINPETGELSPSCYDLLMSEARMTGYFAIASRIVSKKHWGALGRTLAREGRYTGPVSWTGTMFEYFMPYLFLPAPEGSLGFEALRFCAWCQRKRVRGEYGKTDIPWGVSESGFYAFDEQMNYQYKAHGVQKLGLRRGLDSELVVSPYSTFLTLSLEPREAMKNLARLEKLEMSGRCGFYEAADFTPSRTSGQDYAVVRSYMAHHVGMSMLGVLNFLKDDVVKRRFMSDDAMASAKALLEEKIPSGASVFKNAETTEIQKISERVEPEIRPLEGINCAAPRMKLFTNGEWSCASSDTGASVSLYRGASVFNHSDDLLKGFGGVAAFFKTDSLVLPVSKVLDDASGAAFRAEFSGTQTALFARKGGVGLSMKTRVHPRLPCEQRGFAVRNFSSHETLEGELIICFEPSLAPLRESGEHPAFSKLFIRDSFDGENKMLLFERRGARGGEPLCLAAGFTEKREFEFECSKGALLNCGEGIKSIVKNTDKFSGSRGNPEAFAAFKIKLKIPPRGAEKITLELCAAATKSEAAGRLMKLRASGGVNKESAAPCPFEDGGLESVIADALLPQLFYKMRETKESLCAARENRHGKQALWSLGISGDNPIVYIKIHNAADVARARPYIRLNKKLRAAGIATDIAVVFHEDGQYDAPIFGAFTAALAEENAEGTLNRDGGVHAVNTALCSEEGTQALAAFALFIAPTTAERFELPVPVFSLAPLLPCEPAELPKGEGFAVHGGFFGKESFIVDKHEKSTAVPWCHVLANPTFGTMVSDSALGFTWAINSHENRLTPWSNDISLDNRGELLLLRYRGKIYDMLKNAHAQFFADSAQWSGRVGNLAYKVRVSVPEKGMVKRVEVCLCNMGAAVAAASICVYTEPTLGSSRSLSRLIKEEITDNGIVFSSPASTVSGFGALCVADGADFVCRDRAAFLSGRWYSKSAMPLPDPCAAVGKNLSLPPKETQKIYFSLSWAKNSRAALFMAGLPSEKKKHAKIIVSTPDAALDAMINTWLPSQILNSRFFGRTGFYQSSGAWGFRDQLQDISALRFTRPELVRRHLMRCAAVQFEQGDVLHWWHRLPAEDGGISGVRTRCSDDLLWLALETAEYVSATGDEALLDVKIPFLSAPELSEEENERYFRPQRSEIKRTLYEHCVRAIERALHTGEHGLLLMGTGDWNDGMNLVGAEGRGESVWLTQFAALVLTKFSEVCRIMGEAERANGYLSRARLLKIAVDEKAWGGDRYLRAFCDDETPLGVKGAEECAADSLPQSFAVFADMPNIKRIEAALNTALSLLVDKSTSTVALLSPPFTGNGVRAGYIAAYPGGVRENGGQYTHAAMWLCLALIKSGRSDDALELLKMINPASLCGDDRRAIVYRAEPYALAGDVCTAPGIGGRAGWTLYTGSAAWMYRAACEGLFGLTAKDGKIISAPRFPKEWKTKSPKIILIKNASSDSSPKKQIEE